MEELRVAICLALAIALVMIGRILLFSDNQSTGGYDINMITYALLSLCLFKWQYQLC